MKKSLRQLSFLTVAIMMPSCDTWMRFHVSRRPVARPNWLQQVHFVANTMLQNLWQLDMTALKPLQ